MSNDLSKREEFTPSPAMRLWLDTSIQLMTDNISLISDQCKVTRQSWYLWLKDEEFQTWFCSEWDKRLGMFRWKLDVIGLKRAERDFKYWDAMRRKVNPNFNHNAQVTNSIVFSDFDESPASVSNE